MKRFLIASMVVGSFYGLAATADAAPVQQDVARPINVPASVLPQSGDTPYMLAKLYNEIQMLQAEVQRLGSLEGQVPSDSRYIFDAEPSPNQDGSPIPTDG